ncbi:MAG: asparaginase [Vampirovibrionales bacterium]|nr:asparaginase [Vampirovibrionales bacterium]
MKVQACRDGLPETQHAIEAIALDAGGAVLFQTLQAQTLHTFLRSAGKLFQLHAVLSSCAPQSSIPDEALAVAMASHTGSPAHVQWVNWWLNQARVSAQALCCGAHPPLDAETRRALGQQARSPSALHNNCSGKHAAMVYACVQNGWPLTPPENYLAASHPLQQRVLAELSGRLALKKQSLRTAIDGCGVPTFWLTLPQIAKLYASAAREVAAQNFKNIAPATHAAQTEPAQPELTAACLPSDWLPRLWGAATLHPELAGGKTRIDSVLMAVGQGRLLAKVGAEGLIAVAYHHQSTQAGLTLKVLDGDETARTHAVLAVLQHLQWLTEAQVQAVFAGLDSAQALPTRTNWAGTPVGQWQIEF